MSDERPRLDAALEGRYRIERELGAGGMATVWLAHDLRHDRDVALKVLRPELTAALGVDRFLAEVRTTARLNHPHILPLFDSGEADGLLFYVMPFVRGESLRDRLQREHELPVDDAVTLATKVAGALQAAHEQGIVHRDVKPENILLQDGEPLVADFGIALAVRSAGGSRLTETGLSLGTPAYMSPEQATGDREPDARSDVYGLGCVLYEMLAGRPPHDGTSAQQILARVLTEDPPSLTKERTTVPVHVAAVVRTALQRLPADRFPSARAFAAALSDTSFRGSSASSQAPDRALVPTRRPGLRAALVGAATGLAGLALGLALARSDGAAPVPALRQFSNTGDVGCAAISPDGRQVATVEGGYSAETGCAGRLVVRTWPAGAPVELLGGVAEAGDLSWSPDGGALVLAARVAEGERGVWVVPMGTGAPRRLVAFADDGVLQGFPASSVATFKTADSLVVISHQTLRVLDPRSGEVLRSGALDRDLLAANWSERVGAWVAAYYTPGRPAGVAGVLALMDGDFQPLDSLPGYPLSPVWAGPNRVVWLEAGPRSLDLQTLTEVEVEGLRFAGPPRPIRGNVLGLGVSGSAEDARGVVILEQAVDEVTGVALGPGGDGPARVIARAVGSYIEAPSLSPDGEEVAFFRNDLLGPNPYRAGFDGSEAVPLGSRAGRLKERSGWTPDGRAIVLSGHPESPSALYDVAAGTEREIPGTEGIYLGGVSSGALLFLRGAAYLPSRQLALADPVTGAVEDLGEAPGVPGTFVVETEADRLWMTVSDDGGGVDRLVSFHVPSGSWRDHGGFPVDVPVQFLSVDADGFLYWLEAADSTRLWRMRPDDGVPELHRSFGFACILGYGSLTRDTRRFACNATRVHPDAWVLEWPSGTDP